MSANPLSTVGLMLTLASLLGTFFYLHLSQWLRDIVALQSKVEFNITQGTEKERNSIVECRIELKRLGSWHTYVVNSIVIGFVLFVLADGLLMLRRASDDPLYAYVVTAFIVFLVVFLLLATGLLALGVAGTRGVEKTLKRD